MFDKSMNEFGWYDPYYGLTENEIVELHGWLDEREFHEVEAIKIADIEGVFDDIPF